MRLVESAPRPDHLARLEAEGLTWATQPDGRPYWCEDHYYELSLAEVEVLETATEELAELCHDALDYATARPVAMTSLGVPSTYHEWVARSWREGALPLRGRMDLSWDGTGAPRLLEYNADTPTALVEAAVCQWSWLEDRLAAGALPPGTDQWNGIHDMLVDGLRGCVPIRGGTPYLHVVGMSGEGSEEDQGTLAYMAECARLAGLGPVPLPIEQVGAREGRLVDADDELIRFCLKLYPWEWMMREEFGYLLTRGETHWIEPPWASVLSTKALLALLWELNPGHRLLPETYLWGQQDPRARDLLSRPHVSKPLHGREGQGVVIRDGGRVVHGPSAPSGGSPLGVVQEYVPLADLGRGSVVFGSWVVAGRPAGLGLREDDGPITTNGARFVPHVIVPEEDLS